MATQKEVAEHLFLSERRVRDLAKMPGAPVSKGRGGYSLVEWRKFYIDYLKTSGGVDEPETDAHDEEEKRLKLEEKRLRIAERREGIKLKQLAREIKYKEFAPIYLIEVAVGQIARQIYGALEGVLPRLKQAWPEMTVEAVEALNRELVDILNELSNVQPDLSEYIEDDSDYDATIDS